MEADPKPPKKLRVGTEEDSLELNSLPSELFEHIFEFLPFQDQLDASLVCQKWFQVLQISKFFDRVKIVFKDCIIAKECPPYSVFSKTKRSFKSIKISQKIFLTYNPGNDGYNKEKDDFLTKLGEIIEFVEWVDPPFDKFHEYVHFFPSMRELEAHFHNLLSIHDKLPNSLEKVTLIYGLPYVLNQREFEQCNTVKGNLKSIIPLKVELPHQSLIFTEFKVCTLEKCVRGLIRKFNRVANPNARPRTQPIEGFDLAKDEVLLMKHFLWKSLRSEPLPSDDHATTLSGNPNTDGCFFLHQKIVNPKITTISMRVALGPQQYCVECIAALSESYSNVQNFWFQNPLATTNDIIKCTKTPVRRLTIDGCSRYKNFLDLDYHKLEYLELKCSTSGSEVYQKMYSMSFPYLKELYLSFGKVETCELKILMENCPKVTKYGCKVITVDDILAIEEGWPNIEELKFEDMENWEKDLEVFVTKMQGNFRRLQVFGGAYEAIEVMYRRDVHGAIFKKMPRLRASFFMDYDCYCCLEYKLPHVKVPLAVIDNYWTLEDFNLA